MTGDNALKPFRSSPPGPPSAELVAAYNRTDFIVGGPVPIRLTVDQPVEGLAPWMASCGAQRAVVITAYNPFSQALSDVDNQARQSRLVADVEAAGLRFEEAAGHARTGDWQPEPSLCVFDVPTSRIDHWMTEFGQYAVVIADPVEGCWLHWHPALWGGSNG